MRVAASALLSLALGARLASAAPPAPAVPTAPAVPVEASYTAYWSGFPVVTIEVSLDLQPDAYRAMATLRTSGLLALIVDGEQATVSEGRIRPAATPIALLPRRYSMEGRWRDTLRRVRMDWAEGMPEILALLPDGEDEREPVPPELRSGTVDTLTALVALVREAALSGRCDGAAQVFDGRRRSDFTATTDGTETLEPNRWSSFSGPALRCRFEGRQVAGFWKRQDREEAARPRAGTAWLASPGPGLPVMPVRVEAESHWGAVYVHVTRAGLAGRSGAGR